MIGHERELAPLIITELFTIITGNSDLCIQLEHHLLSKPHVAIIWRKYMQWHIYYMWLESWTGPSGCYREVPLYSVTSIYKLDGCLTEVTTEVLLYKE